MAKVAGLGVEQGLDERERVAVPPRSIEHQREVGLRSDEPRIDLDRPPQQGLGVAEATDARSQLGHHANPRNIEGVLLEVRAKQLLGDVEAVVDECGASVEQARRG